MDEAEWLACTDPNPLLDFLRGKVKDRKLRLFACECCRRIWRFLQQTDRKCVEGGEIIAEGGSYSTSRSIEYAQSESEGAALSTLEEDANLAARRAADLASTELGIEAATEGAFSEYAHRILAERHLQTSLLRCIFGPLPFRPVSLIPSWLAWSDGTVVRLAQAIFDERRYEDLPILADALEDAGCDNDDILSHLRGSGPHGRGCWVIDLLLGKT